MRLPKTHFAEDGSLATAFNLMSVLSVVKSMALLELLRPMLNALPFPRATPVSCGALVDSGTREVDPSPAPTGDGALRFELTEPNLKWP
jgi:hypothetical protein